MTIGFLLAADGWPRARHRVNCVNRPRCSNAFRAASRGKVVGRIRRQPTIDPSQPTSSLRVLATRFFYFYDACCRLAVSAIFSSIFVAHYPFAIRLVFTAFA
uniref:Uncharacterized protein n=1 Tax=Paraburkholderia sprentiae WSM5005 TaxID=754502 RepID=A0A1I9YLT2_9BURK